MNQLAVLLTCFNRKENTIKCLQQLFSLKQDVDVYLVDDNSSDGTYESVSLQFPQVNIIKGSGDFFWNRGMNIAWGKASEKDYNYYLWLNDDVILYENCFEELFACAELTNYEAIISGIIESRDKEALYGGTDKNKKLIIPNGKLNPITNMNGNVVLIPKWVFNKIGNLDLYFHHDLGDVDYGRRASKKSIGVFTTRIAIALGEKNNICRVRLNNSNFIKRLKRLYSPLGSNPRIDFYFRNRHSGFIIASTYFFFLHFINIIPDKLNKYLFGNKYI